MLKLLNGDCLNVLPNLPTNSVDMVCADIPYGTTRCKWDSVIDLEQMWRALHRVAKPNAAIVLFSAQPFTSILVSSNLKHWRTEWIWEKGNATNFYNAKRQPLRAHENIQVFYRKPPTYNPKITAGHERKKSSRSKVGSECYGEAFKLAEYDSEERYPRDVLRYSKDTQKLSLNPTQKPLALIKYLIETYSNPGDVVLDFTMGSGTAGVACVETGRSFIGIELDEQGFIEASERILLAQEEAA
ncbi:DNA-methyltransferase [Salmonella enterica]|uniref:DNA-methyltransferase n=1 Tax=Salmonella enterica TaxID=28901 RepID=UPI000B8A615F|nr:site-specific DNA-methyltransferase [Salmonella enterica]OXM32266.1 site-specific DNA-methyltransferase [Salmonella enterica subsp. enterica serovar Weslaco]